MNPTQISVRRATVDDRDALKILWASMRLPADELEKRLTEFQVVENPEGEVVGAIGIQFSKQHALLHSEGYSDFSVADAARQLFWERIQTLAANHGVFRHLDAGTLAVLEKFWISTADRRNSARACPTNGKMNSTAAGSRFNLKTKKSSPPRWKKISPAFMAAEKSDTDRVAEKARTIKTIITVIGFAIGILCFGVAIYLFIHRNPFQSSAAVVARLL